MRCHIVPAGRCGHHNVSRILREPLLHFTAIALLIFGFYYMVTPAGPPSHSGSIVVSSGKIEQMAAIFARTFQRPPSPEELKGLIDDYVTEEIYVREAMALGLDTDDTVIRRRLHTAERELEAWQDYDYVLVNEDLDTCFQQLQSILLSERLKRARNPALAGRLAILQKDLNEVLAQAR